jgi:hypothetical protein
MLIDLTYAMLCSEKGSCYFQALAHIPHTAHEILSYKTLPDVPNTEFILCFQRIIASIRQPGVEGHYISLEDVLKIFPEKFRGNTQQCALELFDHMYANMNDGESQLLSTMTGELKTIGLCKCGRKQSTRYEAHTIVPLKIINTDGELLKSTSVQKMLDNFKKPEMLPVSGNCNYCLKSLPIQKRTVFSKECPVSAFSIGIFEKMDNGRVRKRISRVHVESELSISYEGETSVTTKKQLTCVIYHVGNDKDSGHFICLIRGDDCWHQVNDSNVTRVKDHRLAGSSTMPFIVFYTPMEPIPDEMNHSIRTLTSRIEYLPLINPHVGYSLSSNRFLFFFRQFTYFLLYIMAGLL